MQFTTNNMHTTQMLKESKTEVVRREKKRSRKRGRHICKVFTSVLSFGDLD